MRKLCMFLLLALSAVCGYAQSIDPALEKEMGLKKDDEKIDVFVIMKQQYDRDQLNRRANYYTTRAARREFVVNELKQFADASQHDIRQSLAEMERNDMVTTPKVLWMANALYFSATKQAVYELAQREDVEIIGFDKEVDATPDGEESRPAPRTWDITPNVTQVNADQVWDLGYTGQGVVVAVIDGGINYHHLDLRDHLWDGGEAFPYHGWDVGSNDNDPIEDSRHGTHCAGTVCGDGGGGKKTGIAPDAILMCVKTSGSNGSSTVRLCNGIQWAVEHGCDMFSMSQGVRNASISDRILFRNTCVVALNAGVIGAIAAGNERNQLNSYPIPDNVRVPGSCPPPYLDPVQQANPGGLSCSVCVGAVDYNDVAADFTSRGPVGWSNTSYDDYPYVSGSSTQFGLIRPDVCAPGVDIISADNTTISGYRISSGTSMATPCVAGCMALMLSKNPELTPADICRILEETAVPLAEGKSNIYGYGRVDVLAAINAVPDNLLSLASYVIHDEQGNNNQQLNASESVTMDMNLHCGPNALNNATLHITCNSEYVTITNGTIALPNFAAGQTQTVTGFAFTVDASAPIRRKMTFYADVLVGGTSIGHFAFTLAVEGSTLVYEGATIVNDNNGNGILEPGETADLRVIINNTGNSVPHLVTGTLSVESQHLTINNNGVSIGDIAIYEPTYVNFSVSLAAGATNAFPMPCSISLVDSEGLTNEFDFNLYNITTTANLQGAGALAGAGTYGTGTEVSLTAIADNGHTFISWKKGNTVASYTDFSFNVSENANFVANFNTISNVVPVGQAITSDETIPTHSYYRYSLTEQIYTTEELGAAFEISSVAFFNAGTAKTRNCRIFLKPTEKTVFQSGSDWVAVTENDLLFEGDITFAAGAWTTVYFDRAFSYDGIHNVILVVDDNTGTYSRGLACRVFEDESQIAIFNCADDNNFNPYNPSLNPGYFLDDPHHKNQVLFGVASYDYTVSVSADPANCGTVTVDQGPFFYGQPCTATATPLGDNVFYYWTMDGTRVSSDATYRFAVESSRHLVAHFGPPVAVTVVADPAEGGTVSGGGSLGISQPTTLSATANPGYVFDHWDLNGNVVSYLSTCTVTVPGEAEYVAHFNPTAHGTFAVGQANSTNTMLPSYSYYKYSLTEQIYTADEIGGACHIGSIAFFNTGYEKTRDFTIYLVNTDKTTFSSNTDWIVPTTGQLVFSGQVVMAKDCWTTITFDSEFAYDGTSNLAVIVDDNSGNWSNNHMSCRVYDASGNQSLRIYSDNDNYDPHTPSSYSGTRMSVKNQIILGLSSYHFTNQGNWNTSSNWEQNAIPNGNDATFIDANCLLDTDAQVNTLTVSTGQTLTIQSNHILTVTGELSNTVTSGIVLLDGAQLMNSTANVNATMQKDIIAYGNNNPDGWYTIASPMQGMEIEGSTFLTPEFDLYRYNETSNLEWENYKAGLANFNTFENGRGYLYANGNSFSPTFRGTLNIADVTYPLSYANPSSELRGFNLIGNPFPHVIYKGAGGAIDNANLASGYYTLTNEGVWHVHTYEDAIQPGQGVLVKTVANTQLAITKTNAVATAESNGAKAAAGRIDVHIAGEGGEDRCFVYLNSGTGLEKKDNFSENAPTIWVSDHGCNYAIAHVGDDKKSIDLMFKNSHAGTFTLSIDVNDHDFSYLHLIDHITGDDTDLLQQSTYTFQATGNEFAARFLLVFRKNTSIGDDDALIGSKSFCFVNDEILYFTIETNHAQVTLTDVLGRIVKSSVFPNNSVSVADLKPGVYIVCLKTDKTIMTQKVTIN